MKHAASRELLGYWDALRAGRTAPGRDEVDPAGIRGLLASVFILDVAGLPGPGPADAAFRVSGTRLDALFVRSLRGTTFDRLWAAHSAALAASALGAVLSGRRPVVGTARGGPVGREPVEIELLMLPLERYGGGARPILGSLSVAASPDWMGLSPAAPLSLVSLDPRLGSPRRFGSGRRAARPFTLHTGGLGKGAGTAARP